MIKVVAVVLIICAAAVFVGTLVAVGIAIKRMDEFLEDTEE